MNLAATHDGGQDSEVTQPRAGRRPGHDLEHRLARDLADRHHVPGRRRPGDQRFQPGQVNLAGHVAASAVTGGNPGEIVQPPLAGQEGADLPAGREHAGRGAQLGTHIRDHVPAHSRQRGQAGTVVLDDPHRTAPDPIPAQHLQDHVPWRSPTPAAHQ
jgi:hypothetical protein